jgi:hypothetical protein
LILAAEGEEQSLPRVAAAAETEIKADAHANRHKAAIQQQSPWG